MTKKMSLAGLMTGAGLLLLPAVASAQSAPTDSSTPAPAPTPSGEPEARSQTYVDLTGALGYSGDPSLGSGSGDDNDSSVFGRASAYGVYARVSERTYSSINGFVENTTYFGGGGSRQIYALDGATRYQVSELVSLFASAGLSGDFGGQLSSRFVDAPLAPAPGSGPGEPFPPDFLDPTEISLNQRTTRLKASFGASGRISERDSISASAGFSRVFYKENSDELDYRVINGNLGWNHQASERTSYGANIGIQRANYAGAGNYSTIITPRGNYSTLLAESWSFNLAAGVSITQRWTDGDKDSAVGPSVDASVCRSWSTESNLCGRVSRTVEADVGGAARRTTAIGVDYSTRLSANDRISARVRVARYSGDGDDVTALSRSTYYNAGMSYSRKLSDRLSGGADVGVRKVASASDNADSTDFNASAFVRYRLGDM